MLKPSIHCNNLENLKYALVDFFFDPLEHSIENIEKKNYSIECFSIHSYLTTCFG